jgi:hypothetical protein
LVFFSCIAVKHISRVKHLAPEPESTDLHTDDQFVLWLQARSLSVETDMKPVVAFLEQRGFSTEQILRVTPHIHGPNVQGRVRVGGF